MTVIIVDDEPKAIELLSSYLAHFSNFELVATFRNGLKALAYLNENMVDVIFLDINMPHLNGLSLSKMIDSKAKIIFTTAYSEYAVESYEVKAIDYLLKPISLERFTAAMRKLIGSNTLTSNDPGTTLMIKSGAKIFRVESQEILYLEKDGNYMTYHTNKQQILARESIAAALEKLPHYFLQAHKSHIVNIRKIEFIDRNELSIAGRVIPIGSSFKDALLEGIHSAQ